MALFVDRSAQEAEARHLSDLAFSRAKYKGFMQELKFLVARKKSRLLSFDEVKEKLELWHVKEKGLQSVPINSIIGSQGRYRNFTRNFLPLEENLRTRWKQVEAAVSSGRDLPPVQLYKVCNAYFVKDGHHRISVAKTKNKRTIEAQIFEYECDVCLDDATRLEELTLLETYHHFLKETCLAKSGNPQLQLTVLGGYPLLMEHIQRHRFYLIERQKHDVTLQQAAFSWYGSIYLPIAELIRENGILKHFPHRTEADFYIWISRYKETLFAEGHITDDAKNVIEGYSKVFSRPLRRFWGKFRNFLGFVNYN